LLQLLTKAIIQRALRAELMTHLGYEVHPLERQHPQRGEPEASAGRLRLGDIRKIVYTTNAIESRNMGLRKAIKTRGAFPTEDAALKGCIGPSEIWPASGTRSRDGERCSTDSRCSGKIASHNNEDK